MSRSFRHAPSVRTRSSRAGFSLTEALVALLLVGLMGTIIVAGIPAARNVYNSLLRRENAEVVCTTVSNRIAAELAEATEFTQVEDQYVFVSHSGSKLDGLRFSISAPQSGDDAGRVLVTFYEKKGSTLTALATGKYKPSLLLPEDTYVLGLNAKVTITPIASGGSSAPTSVTLVVDIYYDDATKPLASQTLTVALAKGGDA